MFPWVCLATMPLYYPFDWPKRVIAYAKTHYIRIKNCITFKVNELTTNKICHYISSDRDSTKNVKDNNEEQSTNPNENPDKFAEETNKDETKETSKQEDETENKDALCKNQLPVMKDVATATDSNDDNLKKKRTIYLIAFYVLLQAFLPFSHFITKVRGFVWVVLVFLIFIVFVAFCQKITKPK